MVWILVAVALFAGLSYVVSENMRGGSPELMGAELARNNATEILQFASSVRRAVQTLRIDGVADTEISFENNIANGYTNVSCSSDSCKVFAPGGGGISYIRPSPDWLDESNSARDHFGTYLFTGNACIASVGGGGTDCELSGDDEELLLIVPYLKKIICTELNKKAGINLPSGEPLPEGTSAWNSNPATARFTGSYTNDSEIGDGNAAFRKTRSGCFAGTGTNMPPSGTYHYYEVLLAR